MKQLKNQFAQPLLALSAIAFAAASARADGYDAYAYVRDGLVAQWDGIDNVGTGSHDATSKTWVDLSGNGYNAVYANGNALPWANGNALSRPNNTTLVKVNSITLNLDTSFTFDFCGVQSAKAAANFLDFRPAGKSAAFQAVNANWQAQLSGAGKTFNSNNSFYTGGSLISLHDGATGAHYNVANDTSYVGSLAVGTEGNATGPLFLASNSSGNSRFLGSFHALRIYDRPLTEVERIWNTTIDKIRFFRVEPSAETVLLVGALPTEWGLTGVPTLGSKATVANTDNYAISLNGLSEHPDDGALAREYETDYRARFHGWSNMCGSSTFAVRTTGATTNGVVAVSNFVAQLVWDVRNEMKSSVSAGAGGMVSVNGGTAASSISCWMEERGAVPIEAVPDVGYEFVGWTGDIEGVASVTSAVTTCAVRKPSSIAAFFRQASHTPVTLNWKPGVTSGDFNDPACWAEGAAPLAGDTLYITNSQSGTVTITFDVPTPQLAKLVIANPANKAKTVLSSKNWMSCIRADEVVVASGGVISHDGPYKTERYDIAGASRVWIQAGTLTVESGGKILADGVGYATTDGYSETSRANAYQCGPAWWAGEQPHPSVAPNYAGVNLSGEGYGAPFFKPYGDPVYPSLPGSGGLSGDGGGAIRLEVAGTLTVDGIISANSSNGRSTGGAIWITCDKVTGAGTVQANAKDCAAATSTQSNCAGGAGRVAVHYNPASQAAATGCAVRFEALASVFYKSEAVELVGTYGSEPGKKLNSDGNTTWTEEKLALQGMGSLYFTDGTILKGAGYQSSGWRFGGELVTGSPIGEIVFNQPMTFDKCQLVVRDPGLRVTANAGLNVFGAGYYARREMGVVFSNASVTVNGPLALAGSRFGVRDGTLVVNGDVTLTNAVFSKSTLFLGGELVAFAGPTNAPGQYGATVTVNGNCRIGTGGVLHVECEPYNGAIVKVNVNGRMTVDEGGRVDSDMGGYRYGPGSAITYNPAASHGGRGSGEIASKLKPVYDSYEEPVMPGSGGGQVYGRNIYSIGGGVVMLEVAKKLTLNGVISADSNRKWAGNYLTPGSGGTVNIRARRLTGTGCISASGGASNGYGLKDGNVVTNLAAGAGGRIAVRTMRGGCDWTAVEKETRVVALAGPRAPLKTDGKTDYTRPLPDPLVYDAEHGTVYWEELPAGGLILVK